MADLESLSSRLEKATKKRESLAADVQRLTGKYEAAQKSLEGVEEEIRKRGIEPDALEQTVEALAEKYRTVVESLEQEVAAAELSLAPFLEKNR